MMQTQLFEDVIDMCPDGRFRDEKPLGDLSVGHPAGHQFDNLTLSMRQLPMNGSLSTSLIRVQDPCEKAATEPQFTGVSGVDGFDEFPGAGRLQQTAKCALMYGTHHKLFPKVVEQDDHFGVFVSPHCSQECPAFLG